MHLIRSFPRAQGALGKVSLAVAGAVLPGLLGLGGSTTTLSAGHVDAIDIAWEDGEFALSVHDETVEPSVERDPAAVRFVAKSESAVVIPDDPAYGFLGSPGQTAWILPEVQDENLLWPGISTGELEPGVFENDQVKVKFTRVLGPNGFSLFDTAQDGGPHLLVDSEDGLPDVVTLEAGTHQHASWAFEAPGTYEITYRVKGRLAATGTTAVSEPVTLTFVVQNQN